MSWLLVLLPVAVIIDAVAQGKLNLVTRQWVPPTAQKQVNLPLHYMYPWLYVLLVGAVYVATWNIAVLPVGLLLRLVLFDPALNYAKGDEMFAVGSSAATDNLLKLVAAKLGVKPETISMLLRSLALIIIILFLVI
ncbi:hypothetical protein K3G63_06590 [Hymenobacter sp. HSC-4F20]|uniref:hypothetical protein n=1 Tax=Hymenobacter sp. HSC-4F20 TaxID=2864135 RepID=UPI001C739DBD|nr:hypothetical protein [Hymenobacter sp. HSC-4F20]MBX0290098.1 hypothetical protein [Hymenobacter sp. HSC-4F20]